MFNRLDLQASNCQRVCAFAHVSLPRALAKKVYEGSHNVTHEKHRRVIYGSLYRRRGHSHVIRADADTVGKGHHVHFEIESEEMDAPPKTVRRPELLEEILAEYKGQLEFDCTATFVYREDDSWTSLPTLPAPLPKPIPPFTHLESITVSSREKGRVDTSLRIRITSDHEIIHNVSIRLRGSFTDNILGRVLSATAKHSKRFVSKGGQ